MVNKSYKVSILALIFISSKTLEASFHFLTSKVTNYIKDNKSKDL